MFEELFNKYGDTVKLYIGDNLHIFTYNSEIMEGLLKSNVHLKKSAFYDLTEDLFGKGLGLSHGAKWKQRRKLITPCFHFSILKEFFLIFKERSDILIQKLGEQADKGATIDAKQFVAKCALDIICESALGTKLKTQEGLSSDYIQSLDTFTEILTERSFSLWKRFNILFKAFAKEFNIYQEAIRIMDTKALKIIEEKQKEHENLPKVATNNDTGDEFRKKANLIDILIQHKELTHADVREEVNTFIGAGYDTTATLVSFCLIELSTRPDIQEKLYEEFRAYIGDDVKNLAQDTVLEMKYLDMVFKELLRLRPSLPFIGRYLEEDAKFGDIVYPKGTTFLMSIYGLHRNPKYFPDPEKFDPERFNPNNSEKIPPFAYLPFSAGPRNCIGQKYGTLEAKTMLARIIMEFKILPVENGELKIGYSGTIRSKNGYKIKLERRKPLKT